MRPAGRWSTENDSEACATVVITPHLLPAECLPSWPNHSDVRPSPHLPASSEPRANTDRSAIDTHQLRGTLDPSATLTLRGTLAKQQNVCPHVAKSFRGSAIAPLAIQLRAPREDRPQRDRHAPAPGHPRPERHPHPPWHPGQTAECLPTCGQIIPRIGEFRETRGTSAPEG